MSIQKLKNHFTSGSSQQLGQDAESIAFEYLLKQGLIPITRNFRSKRAEIDLIMRDKQYIVFIEVRFRTNLEYGLPSESVTLSKQKRIIQAALCFLQQKNWLHQYACRFDIVGLQPINSNLSIKWQKNAFQHQYYN